MALPLPTPTPTTTMVAMVLLALLLLQQPTGSSAFISIHPSSTMAMELSPSFSHHSSSASSSLLSRSNFSPSDISMKLSAQPSHHYCSLHHRSVGHGYMRRIIQLSSTWDNFAYDDDLDDDDDTLLLDTPTNFVPADENDDPSVKAAAGMALQPPEVDYDGPIIDVPQGSTLELDEETVQGVLAACRQEIGTMFGYQAENRGVGITGGVDFVELDGPTVVLHLKGRFWHQRPTVLKRVGAYLMARIPEIVDVIVADEYELTDEANNDAI